ncbi:hypothetical protein ABH900_001065 [Stenotrophomonas sp. AN71]|uniref:hypothetical protein n=1 Tax=Stenotrophomonas sp. AN71 TaxID=3156253 RepID=UPI003D1E2C20
MRGYRSAVSLALVAGIAVTACTPTPAPPPARSECPYAEFEGFLKHFGNEITLQERATADPLLDSYIDAEAEPEPRKVESRLALADVEWPVMPDPAALAGQGREMQISVLADGQRQVQIRTPDSSDQQTYTFAQAPCWTLVKREDESI